MKPRPAPAATASCGGIDHASCAETLESLTGPQAAESLHRWVARVLAEGIAAGAHPIGSRLPTEQELCRKFNVSRHTIREGLRDLRATGIVASRQGSGTVVVGRSDPDRFSHAPCDDAAFPLYPPAARLTIDVVEVVATDSATAARLSCEDAREWLLLAGRLNKVDEDLPFGWIEAFVHPDYAGIRDNVGRNSGPIYSWIERDFGEHVSEVRQTIRATSVSARLATVFDCAEGVPALEIQRIYASDAGKVVEIAFSVHPADRFDYSACLRRPLATSRPR